MSLGKVNKNSVATWEARIYDQTVLYRHPNYNAAVHLNDIGLINLREASPDILNSPFISTINLPSSDDGNINLIGMSGLVSGFGSTGGLPMSNLLNVAELTIVDNQFCREWFPSYISEENLCTEATVGRATCIGDDGEWLI